MLHRANTATTYSLAFLEKILIIHWYTWLYCLLSAIIIHTEDLLHCKWWKYSLEERKTEKKEKEEGRWISWENESWDAIERDSSDRESERESPMPCQMMSKMFATMCWRGKSKPLIFNLSAVVAQVSLEGLRWKLEFFSLLFGEIFVKIILLILKC